LTLTNFPFIFRLSPLLYHFLPLSSSLLRSHYTLSISVYLTVLLFCNFSCILKTELQFGAAFSSNVIGIVNYRYLQCIILPLHG
jgi:hypothetical protein